MRRKPPHPHGVRGLERDPRTGRQIFVPYVDQLHPRVLYETTQVVPPGPAAGANQTYVTAANECASLPNSRQLAVSGDLTKVDNGSCGTIVVGHTPQNVGFQFVSETEVDFGTTPVMKKLFTVIDVNVSATSKILAALSSNTPTGGSDGDPEADAITFLAKPGTGSFSLIATAHEGPVVGKRKVFYGVGA